MRASSSSILVPEAPTPASAVERQPETRRRRAVREAVLIDYFTHPSPEMQATDAAWEEAIARYGDEDSDAWVAALEDGTHPLCRLRVPPRSA